MSGGFTLNASSAANAWREKGYRDGAAGREVSKRALEAGRECSSAYMDGYGHGERSRSDRDRGG